MKRTIKYLIIILILFLSFSACDINSSGGSNNSDSRSFLMGFTSWPYEATIPAVADNYNKLHAHGDIITHHLDGGVPWPEAYADNATYGSNLEGDISLKLSNTDSDIKVCLAVCPLNVDRNAPANYWADGGTNQARTSPWDSYDFSDNEMRVAYKNFILNLINRFDPDYCNYGIEATEYLIKHKDDADFAAKAADLFAFLQYVYNEVKAIHPNLPLFISVTLKDPDSTETALVQGYSAQIAACTDLIGISSYGYIFYGHANSGNPGNLPTDWLSQAQNYAPGKPLAITETGWVAEDLVIAAYSINTPATEENQNNYVSILLNEANNLDAVFVTWFCAVDFDTLWSDTLGSDPLAQIWRDTGLYDENLSARTSLTTWDSWLSKIQN